MAASDCARVRAWEMFDLLQLATLVRALKANR